MSRKKQQTDLFKTKMICQKVVRSDKLLKLWVFFSTFLLTSHFLTFLYSSIPGISFSSASVLALNSNILGWNYLTKLIVCFAATSLAIKSCHQKVLFPVVVGVFWEWCTLWVIPGNVPGSNSSSLQICSGLPLEVHTSQTEDSSPCWPHSISPTVFSLSQIWVLLFLAVPKILSGFALLRSRKLSIILSADSGSNSHPASYHSSSFWISFALYFFSPFVFLILSVFIGGVFFCIWFPFLASY